MRLNVMDRNTILFWMTVVGTLCWPICFLWMRQLSLRQHTLLTEIQEQAKRIEELSRAEHDLIREVHPQVSEIKEELDAVADTVKDIPGSTPG
jgi:hypothetical protein